MTLTPEIIAKLIFQISNLRWLEREYANDPNWYRRDEILTLSRRIDEFLIIHGFYDHKSFKEILQSITEDEKPLKKAI